MYLYFFIYVIKTLSFSVITIFFKKAALPNVLTLSKSFQLKDKLNANSMHIY